MRKNIKLIALDIDGVLNSADFCKKINGMSHKTFNLDPAAVSLLNKFIKETSTEEFPTKILLSSTWRTDFATIMGVNMFFEAVGIEPVCVGMTNYDKSVYRGDEILEWIAKMDIRDEYLITNFVILDDDGDMNTLKPWLAHCPNKTGFTKNIFKIAKDIIKKSFDFKIITV